MRISQPGTRQWSGIIIDAAKNMGGLDLTNLGDLYVGGIDMAGSISTLNVDNAGIGLRARTNGVGRTEVAKIVGAATPYFQLTLPSVLPQTADPATVVSGHFVNDQTANKLKIHNGTQLEYIPLLHGSTYVGNGTNGRQIVTGFTCHYVIILSPAATSGPWVAHIIPASAMSVQGNGTGHNITALVFLHATNGFVVSWGDVNSMNENGITYYYLAM